MNAYFIGTIDIKMQGKEPSKIRMLKLIDMTSKEYNLLSLKSLVQSKDSMSLSCCHWSDQSELIGIVVSRLPGQWQVPTWL